ncbi:MAG: YheV family putative metal-binding protein, partial [Litorivicinaceae bacterium]
MPIKRFIAGAVCHQCGIQDRVRAWEDEGEKLMRR